MSRWIHGIVPLSDRKEIEEIHEAIVLSLIWYKNFGKPVNKIENKWKLRNEKKKWRLKWNKNKCLIRKEIAKKFVVLIQRNSGHHDFTIDILLLKHAQHWLFTQSSSVEWKLFSPLSSHLSWSKSMAMQALTHRWRYRFMISMVKVIATITAMRAPYNKQ